VIEHVERDTAPVRFALTLLSVFAVAAGLLAFVGLYGVVAYTVGRRAREIGIRVALGSDRGAIQRRFVAEGARLTAIGVVLGIALSLASTRLLDAYLFGIRPHDPATFALVAAGVVTAALLATWLPARRASRLDPVDVLGSE
jgi:ABC-type antimicrobial peptide transport system permease subunit